MDDIKQEIQFHEPEFAEVDELIEEEIMVRRTIIIGKEYILDYINNYFSVTSDQMRKILITIDTSLDDVIGELIKESINEHRSY